MDKRIKGKNAIVIGAGSGIGKATAWAFYKKGYGLALGDIDQNNLSQAKKKLGRSKQKIWMKKVDAADPLQVAAFVEDATKALSHVEVLAYTAGVGRFNPLVDMAPDQWNKVIAVNLNGAFYFARAVAQQIIRQRSGGVLLFVSSTAAIFNCNQLGHYCASKAGLNMLVKCLASELGNYRIRANAVMPGVTETNMASPMLKQERYAQMIKATVPAGRWAQPKEIADFLLFLASEEASFINGQAMGIDGGQMAKPLPEWWPLDYTKDQEINWGQLFRYYPYAGRKEGA